MAAVLALLMFRQASPDAAGLGYAVLSGALASGVGAGTGSPGDDDDDNSATSGEKES